MGLSLYAKWITFDPDPFSVSTTLKMYEFVKKNFFSKYRYIFQKIYQMRRFIFDCSFQKKNKKQIFGVVFHKIF